MNPPRPTSSPLRPAPGDDLRNRPRPSSPSPLGDEVELESKNTPCGKPSDLVPGTRSNPASFNPGTQWLITPRTKDAWTAAVHLLEDGNWHQIEALASAMHNAGLAHRTIENHLRSASARRWIQKQRDQVRLLDPHTIEAALVALDGV